MSNDPLSPSPTAPLTFSQFQHQFPFSDLVRCFRLQRQLFEFLDAVPHTSNPSEVECDPWIPLSVEFDSDANVLTKRNACGQTLHAMINSGPSIFRRAPANTDVLSLGIHGPSKPSEQQRYFVAVRTSYIYSLHQRLPPLHQHFYEIIREHQPCHFYLDVEQDFEFLNSDDYKQRFSTLASDATSPRCGGGEALPPSSFCSASCAITPDHTQTTEVLLRTLGTFLSTRNDLQGISIRDSDVVVLKSVSMIDLAKTYTTPQKFSQHYILRFHNTLFQNNRHVGALVRDYVEWLYELSTTDDVVHRSLFFHGHPESHPYLRRQWALQGQCATDDSIGSTAMYEASNITTDEKRQCANEQPPLWLSKRCIIDTAVYSRNRMFRCWGSTKLGKSLVLALDSYCSGETDAAAPVVTAPTEDAFLQSLISCGVGTAGASNLSLIVLVKGVDDGGSLVGSRHRIGSSASSHTRGERSHFQPLPSMYPDIDALVINAARKLPPSNATGGSQRVTQFSVAYSEEMPSAVLYPIVGTRYCANIKREHKSNGIYFVANLVNMQIFLKCHDPDCRFSIPDAVSMIPQSALPAEKAPLVVPSTTESPSKPFYMASNEESMKFAASLRTPAVLKRSRSADHEATKDD